MLSSLGAQLKYGCLISWPTKESHSQSCLNSIHLLVGLSFFLALYKRDSWREVSRWVDGLAMCETCKSMLAAWVRCASCDKHEHIRIYTKSFRAFHLPRKQMVRGEMVKTISPTSGSCSCIICLLIHPGIFPQTVVAVQEFRIPAPGEKIGPTYTCAQIKPHQFQVPPTQHH